MKSAMHDVLLSPLRLSELELLIENSVRKAQVNNNASPSENAPSNKPLSVGDTAEFLGIAPQTVYQNIKKIPHHKRLGRLYFFEGELLAYLKGEAL